MDWLNENKTSKTPFYSIVKPLITHNGNNINIWMEMGLWMMNEKYTKKCI